MIILVGSKNEDKKLAVLRAFQKLFPDLPITVVGVPAGSGINEQPLGNDETIRGAENRLCAAIATKEPYDYVVAMENGIMPVGNLWFDAGWVIVQSRDGKRGIACSAGVNYPTAMVAEAMAIGFKTTTVGSIAAQHAGVTNSSDSQSILTWGAVCRVELLEQAIRAALGRMV